MKVYYLTVGDTYKVEAESEEEAKEKLKKRIGGEGYQVYHVDVQKVRDMEKLDKEVT